jgi:diadenosine tetraphosphate (Ap4A) HIT family hydrolase
MARRSGSRITFGHMADEPRPAESCYSCATNQAEPAGLPPRERILIGDGWRAAHAFTTAMPGWLVVIARRHVVSLADLTAAEAAELGLVTWRLSKTLTRVLGCQKTYVACFAEATGFEHLHVHVIPRAPDLPANARGPAVFEHLRQPESSWVPHAEMDRIATLLSTNPSDPAS